MDFRKVFNQIPEAFDRCRPRYCQALFDTLIETADVTPRSRVLEIGPGTGQATEPMLRTGCDYTGVELGEPFAALLREKYASYPNYTLRNADFETCPFAENSFDLVYAAATMQWIPEEIAYAKTYAILKPGGWLAMFMTRSDDRTANPPLRAQIDAAYDRFFHPEHVYTCKLDYQGTGRYGFVEQRYAEWKQRRVLTADEYVAMIGTHCDHIELKDPDRTRFFEAIRQAILAHGNQIVIDDTIPLYLARKPL